MSILQEKRGEVPRHLIVVVLFKCYLLPLKNEGIDEEDKLKKGGQA